MKTKWILGILAVVLICLIFSIGQGADKFYYGSYGGMEYPSILTDSLKFNIVESMGIDSSNIGSLAACSLRAIVHATGENNPTDWAWNSHYTLWEAEGFLGSLCGFTYTGGRLVSDQSASGGKAQLFERFRDQPGLVQTGPGYYQELGPSENPIRYTAEFRLKSPDFYPRGSGLPDSTVCILKIVGTGEILADKMVYKRDFKNCYGYKTFKIEDYTILHPEDSTVQNPIEFQIYWFGNRTLYIDYVKVYDGFGWDLIDDPIHWVANNIKAYVDQDWTKTVNTEGDTVIYRWYGRDEPPSIDLYMPHVYIDSLLKEVSQERVLFQAYSGYWNPDAVYEYMLRENPKDYCIDPYPTPMFGNNYTGPAYQLAWDTYISWLNRAKIVAHSLNKDLWVTIQAHIVASSKDSIIQNCPFPLISFNNIDYCPLFREPAAEELRLQTFLSLCYGAQAILHYQYGFRDLWWVSLMETGLYDNLTEPDSSTYKWREIKEFISPRVEKLGPVFNQLTWQGACFYDEVGSFVLRNGESSYIDSITGRHPDSTYVEVGFFEGYGVYEGDYFMLVNRRCLEGEDEVLNVYFNLADGPYLVTDMLDPGYPDGKICGISPYIISLLPGEGKLFRLDKIYYPALIYVPSYPYPTIQSAIDVSWWATTILVAEGTYYENLDFKGRNPTVASYFHDDGDTSHISRTIIDGSMPADSEFASVVRFVSGETSCATLKGFTIRNGSGTIYLDRSEPGKYGGGIYCWDSSPTIMNNVIIGDTVTTSGGGIYCRNSSPQILNNLIKENEAGDRGGGIAILPYFQEYATPIISNNVIVDNLAGDRGGGIYYWASPFIINNTIDSNSARLGGGIYVHSEDSGHIENNIITNTLQGDGISGESGPEVMSYNDVWNNDSLDFGIAHPEGVGNMEWGVNRNGTPCDSFYNIIQDPGFYDGYHLNEDSACVDAGDNDAPHLLPTDFEGNPRVVDFVDMGAYEYQGRSGGGGGAKIAGCDTTAENKSTTGPPKAFELLQNYPNPFNPVTNVRFTVGSDQPLTHITLKIYNISGQLVKTLVDEEKTPGTYIVTWDGKNNSGKEVASGIYFYQLKSKNFRDTKRMIIIK